MMLVWYAQELQSSCVAACVRMVLGGLGAQVAEAPVRCLIGHTRLGVSLTVAQMQLSKVGRGWYVAYEAEVAWFFASLALAMWAVGIRSSRSTYPKTCSTSLLQPDKYGGLGDVPAATVV
jgi:hypothetical protein